MFTYAPKKSYWLIYQLISKLFLVINKGLLFSIKERGNMRSILLKIVGLWLAYASSPALAGANFFLCQDGHRKNPINATIRTGFEPQNFVLADITIGEQSHKISRSDHDSLTMFNFRTTTLVFALTDIDFDENYRAKLLEFDRQGILLGEIQCQHYNFGEWKALQEVQPIEESAMQPDREK